MNALRALTALALFGVFAACVTEPLRERSPLVSAEPPMLSGASAAVSAAPLGGAAATASAQATSDVPTPAPTATELPPRDGAPGSTRGTIACGAARCDANTQICVPDFKVNAWSCIAKDAPRDNYFACDDGTDCPQGETCCQGFASANTEVKCSTRSGREADCAAEVCSPGGARCPAGQRCEGGYCRVETAASCVVGKGQKVRCGKDAPFCLWGAEPRCATRDEAAAVSETLGDPDTTVRGVHSCTKGSDCGSMACCTGGALGPAMTYCANACDAANTMRVCDTNSDCLSLKPFYCAGDPSCQVVCARDLEAASSLPDVSPPWMKVCVKRERR